jgi:hypothetical protein
MRVGVVEARDQVFDPVFAEIFEAFSSGDAFAERGVRHGGGGFHVAEDFVSREREARVEEHGIIEMELLAEDPVRLLGGLAARALSEIPAALSAGAAGREIQDQEQDQRDPEKRRDHQEQAAENVRFQVTGSRVIDASSPPTTVANFRWESPSTRSGFLRRSTRSTPSSGS